MERTMVQLGSIRVSSQLHQFERAGMPALQPGGQLEGEPDIRFQGLDLAIFDQDNNQEVVASN